MGTNYYLKKKCDCCGNVEEIHICKSLIMFNAPTSDSGEVLLSSWSEWKSHLRSLMAEGGYEIRDEYDNPAIPINDFMHDVENTEPKARNRQYVYMREHHHSKTSLGPEKGMTWEDSDGFTFTAAEFS